MGQTPKPPTSQPPESDSLIDFSEDVPASTNAHNKSTAMPRGLLDDHQDPVSHVSGAMGSMNLMEPLKPKEASDPIKRTDTNDSEVDKFYDAES